MGFSLDALKLKTEMLKGLGTLLLLCIFTSQVAEIMNEHFINVKVDREERPDVDKGCKTFQPRIFHPQISTQDSLTMNYFSTINIFSMNLELKSPWLKPKLYIPSTTKTILMLWYKN